MRVGAVAHSKSWILVENISISNNSRMLILRYRVAYTTLLCRFPFSQLTSVNNFQLVPIDSPAALSPLSQMSETDESRGECEKAGTGVLQRAMEQSGCSSWSPAFFWHRESGNSLKSYRFSENPPWTFTHEQQKAWVYFVFNSESSSFSFFYSVSSLGFIFHSLNSIAKLKLA